MPMGFGLHEHGAPLVMGKYCGVRAFEVVSGLRGTKLQAATNGYNWTPGENQARCLIAETIGISPRHRVASKNCSCGFYAYFGSTPTMQVPHNSYQNPRTVMGLVEAWGTVTYGEHGFQASKAKVVALVDPWEGKPPPSTKMSRKRRWRERLFTSWCIAWPFLAAYEVLTQTKGNPWLLTLFLLTFFLSVTNLFVNIYYRIYNSRLTLGKYYGHYITPKDMRALCRRYKVPVYPTLEEAIAAHPPTTYDQTPEGAARLEERKKRELYERRFSVIDPKTYNIKPKWKPRSGT